MKETSDHVSGNDSLLRLCYCTDELRRYGKCVSPGNLATHLLIGWFQREMPVFGFIQGQVVVGMIVSKCTDLTWTAE